MDGVQAWVSKHKLGTIGGIWAAAVGGSFAANNRSSTPALKPSLRLIHARMHAQAITLAVLSGAAIYHHFHDQMEANRQPIGGLTGR
ncbi:unnamed protein product [Linum tenue]|uniref:HIG1 domain-containing protein n=1 Tax=Linum tenue TaxID=586396 RepID=A0AAV0HT25_9ROSI|nr:unnamed protein product [Linum tenue]